ncbi:MAG: helix-turn-helix domain-containing protein [candidate division NC10 bacterium]|nr:helix-turn-helix domain-containing protein [candidate division NC10 bacterium]
MERLGELVKGARRRKSLTQAELSRMVGVSSTYVTAIENSFRIPSLKVTKELARTLDLDENRLIFLAQQERMSPEERERLIVIPKNQLEKLEWPGLEPIPILPASMAGYGKSHAHAEGFIERHPNLRDVFAYALKIEGDSMIHRLFEGDLVIASPAEVAKSHDLAVVRHRDDRVWVRKVIFNYGDLVTLQSFNPLYEPLTFKKEEVEVIHKIVWIKPR